MIRDRLPSFAFPALFLLVILLGASVSHANLIPSEVEYHGTWAIQPSGDVRVTRVFSLPLALYSDWKANNFHMLEMRNLSPSISAFEVVDQEFVWDDIKRTLTLTMTAKGMANYVDGAWEARMVPGLKFSNLDEARRRAFFHMVAATPFGVVSGQDVIEFPVGSKRMERSGDTLRYSLPVPTQASGTGAALWALGVVFLLLGGTLLVFAGRIPAKTGTTPALN